MDSDEDELGFFDATATPYRVERYIEKGTKTNGRVTVAGPSSKPPSKTRSNTRKRQPVAQDNDDGVESSDANAEDDVVIVDEPGPSPRKGRSKRAASREPDAGSSKAKGGPRGKGKARSNDARDPSPEVMDIDNLEAIRTDAESEREPQDVPRPAQAWSLKRNQSDGGSAAWKKREERHKRELERLQRQCQDALKQRDNLARQLEELFQIRNTEAEVNAEQQAAIYESRISAQEEMIQELTSQLARVDSLTRERKTSTLHFLTREAADEERRDVERQVEKLKQALKDKERIIAEKDKTIQEQAEEIRQLKRELEAEIQMSKTLASSRPNGREVLSRPRIPSETKSGVTLEGKKATEAHKLYEDLTNILILDCHCEATPDANEEQWVFSCLYAPNDNRWNLAFTLRVYNEIDEEVGSVEKVAYTPKEMSDKSPEWQEKLDFLADEFTFHRRQLDVFLDKLYTAMTQAQESTETEE